MSRAKNFKRARAKAASRTNHHYQDNRGNRHRHAVDEMLHNFRVFEHCHVIVQADAADEQSAKTRRPLIGRHERNDQHHDNGYQPDQRQDRNKNKR